MARQALAREVKARCHPLCCGSFEVAQASFVAGASRLAHGQTITQNDMGGGTAALGTISKYGDAPEGFVVARGASSWTLSSSVGINVAKANSASPDFTLNATLSTPTANGVTFKLNGSPLSDAAATTLTTTGAYGTTQTFAWDIVIQDSAASAPIDNVINFTAISN